jgi:hypothetical protein
MSGRTNGELVSLASMGFDVFVTADKNLAYQHNAATLPIAVVVLDALANDLSSLLPLMPGLERALGSLAPRTLVRVSALSRFRLAAPARAGKNDFRKGPWRMDNDATVLLSVPGPEVRSIARNQEVTSRIDRSSQNWSILLRQPLDIAAMEHGGPQG